MEQLLLPIEPEHTQPQCAYWHGNARCELQTVGYSFFCQAHWNEVAEFRGAEETESVTQLSWLDLK